MCADPDCMCFDDPDKKTCKNCKWWNRPVTVKNSCDYDNVISQISVDVLDDSGLRVNFITSPDFGCNKFEKKLDK